MSFLSKTCFILLALFLFSCSKNEIKGDLIITNITVIDVEHLESIPNRTIVISGNQITAVTAYSKSDTYDANMLVDGSDKYIIPGLWDMHVHYATSNDHPNFRNLFIANGVLGVRDLWGNLKVRDSLNETKTLMPKTFLSGEIIDGPFTLLQGSLQPKSAEEAVQIVDSLHAQGADFIKVYDDLSENIYAAIAKRCKELNMPFAGHTPDAITAIQASEAGQKSIEHLNGIFESVSSQQAEIDSMEIQFKNYFMKRDIPNAINTFTNLGNIFRTTYDDNQLIKMARVLNQNETYITPTLITHYQQWYRKDKPFSENEDLKYIPQAMIDSWDPNTEFPTQLFTEETWTSGKNLVTTAEKITGRLNAEHVKLLAGTDCGNFYIVPGFSLHDELELMVKSGLSNGEALQTATLNATDFFNLTRTQGTITEQKIASLVLLNGNPLKDISETKNIDAVIFEGVYLSSNQLNTLLHKAEVN